MVLEWKKGNCSFFGDQFSHKEKTLNILGVLFLSNDRLLNGASCEVTSTLFQSFILNQKKGQKAELLIYSTGVYVTTFTFGHKIRTIPIMGMTNRKTQSSSS